MDTETNTTSNATVKKIQRKNEKKKKMDPSDTDKTLDEVCHQMSKLAVDEVEGSGSPSSTDSEELVNAINYNTITSLAALKDIIQGEGNDTPETDSFFQHYFMNHCNNLSSRSPSSAVPFSFPERRRLSQCREEDEDDVKKESDPPPSAVSSETCSEVASLGSLTILGKGRDADDERNANIVPVFQAADVHKSGKEQDTQKRTVMGAKHKFLVTTAEPPVPTSPVVRALRAHVHNAHTVHFGTKGAEEQRPSARSIFAGENLHRDKKYFDSSLIEIRSTSDGIQTSSEDIWVKRTEDKHALSPKADQSVSKAEESKKDPKKDENQQEARARSGTWSSSNKEKDVILRKTPNQRDKEVRRSGGDKRQKREQCLDAAVTRSTQSVGERRRRGSNDDGQPHQMYQQTIHGTSGVSRRPALFDIFKSKQRSGDAKKPPSIMKQVRTAVQNMTKPTDKASKPETTKPATETGASVSPSPVVKTRDGSAHPHPGSDKKYYHTVTASNSRRPSAMAKMIDIFRGRASVPVQGAPVEAAERRKARAIAQQQHFAAGKLHFL